VPVLPAPAQSAPLRVLEESLSADPTWWVADDGLVVEPKRSCQQPQLFNDTFTVDALRAISIARIRPPGPRRDRFVHRRRLLSLGQAPTAPPWTDANDRSGGGPAAVPARACLDGAVAGSRYVAGRPAVAARRRLAPGAAPDRVRPTGRARSGAAPDHGGLYGGDGAVVSSLAAAAWHGVTAAAGAIRVHVDVPADRNPRGAGPSSSVGPSGRTGAPGTGTASGSPRRRGR